MPANWKIDDNAMQVFTGEGKKPGQGSNGDILYPGKKYKNFELSIDFKAGKAGNSGIFYYVREVKGEPIYYAAPEVQVLDNVDASDNKVDSHLAGSLYDILPCDPKTVHPALSWNTVVVKVKDGHATHTMNGKKVVEYERGSEKFRELVAMSKYKAPDYNANGRFGEAPKGHILLQDHGNRVFYRNMKIKTL